jgi:cytochrome b involved in lipid metabolism
MDFHPGGDAELMRGVGQDGTSLFNQVGSATVTTGNAHENFTYIPSRMQSVRDAGMDGRLG